MTPKTNEEKLIEREEKFRVSVIYTVMNVWAVFWFVIGLTMGLWI